jgi:hypothetical protein
MINVLPTQDINHLIAYTASNVKTLLDCSSERLHYQHRLLPTLHVFIKHSFYYCKLTPNVLVVALIYLNRLKNNLPRKSKGGNFNYTIKKNIFFYSFIGRV